MFCSYLPTNENAYTDNWLKKKLRDYFGDDVIITEGNGTSIITFEENAYSILKEGWKTKKMSNEEEKCLIIDMAAAIIRDSIRSKPCPMDEYPNMIYLGPEFVRKDIPSQLDRFLSGVIKTKANNTQSVPYQRKAVAFNHICV